MANLGFERAWEKLGGTLVRTKVGDQHVHAEMVAAGPSWAVSSRATSSATTTV
jgi:phosphomannomutase